MFDEPEWQGEPLAGRTLLLFTEYGLGDAINFVRYVPMLADRGGRILLQVQPALVSLLRPCCPVSWCSRAASHCRRSICNCRCSAAADLPHHRRDHPAHPYLQADPSAARWREALSGVSALKVGVVWSGNPRHKGDASARYRRTSAAAAGDAWRPAQPAKERGWTMRRRVTACRRHRRPRADARRFADTAAAVCSLDLVIAVDTSVASPARSASGLDAVSVRPRLALLRDAPTPWHPLRQNAGQTAGLDGTGVDVG